MCVTVMAVSHVRYRLTGAGFTPNYLDTCVTASSTSYEAPRWTVKVSSGTLR